jgi:hypothetical protein
VHSALKFSAVFGTTSAYSSNVTLPAGLPPIDKSKNTVGFFIAMFDNALLRTRGTDDRDRSDGVMSARV